jgi:hypothetical protein
MSTSPPGPADRGGSWKLKAVLVVGLVAAVAVAVWLSDRGDNGMLAEVSPVVTEPYRSQPCEPRTAVDGTLADVGIVAVGYTLEGAQYRPDL